MWLNTFVEHLEIAEPVVARFDAAQLRKTASRFAVLDRTHLTRTAARLMRRYAEHGIRQRDRYPDEAARIQKQAALKRRHMPLRQLFQLAPNALLAVKPCWAMSPLVVSQVLPSDNQYFDVVIFDEASQVTPADAIPSIMRGRSVVVAGDDRQLPPTSFFMATQPEDEEKVESEALEIDLTKGFESVLDSLAALLPITTLDWHYRSEDERLIAFSNASFYDGKLITFPGISGRGSIDHVLVRGQARPGDEESVSAEVAEVVRLVLSQATEHPDETLGVIAMGITHANRIEEALRIALQGRPQFDAFFDEKAQERFFVKNLERVQGDERDAIILSVGYGKSVDGRMLYRFGPINLEGGERRLNVAVTRARRRMTVVSSFSAAEMDPERTTKRGPRLLREYLAYAEASGQGAGNVRISGPGSDIPSNIKAGLARRGIESEVRIGSSSQWIDVAVSRPEEPTRFLLAVETDGPGYKANVTTRNRDRLRREQLERLGWRHMRLWSLEWFRDPEGALDRIADAMTWAMEASGSQSPRHDSPETVRVAEAAEPVASRGPKPQLGWFSKIDDIRFDRLVALIDWIESDGLLRTEDEVLAEAVQELGFQRRGVRIESALRQAIAFSRKKRSAR